MDVQAFLTGLWVKYGDNVLGMGRKILIAVLIIIAGKIVVRISRRIMDRALTGKTKFKTDETLISVLRKVIQYVVMIICLIMILDIFGVSTASLIALLGAAGVAIGFALRDTLKNIATGIVILVLRPFNRGDFIECGPVSGIVREIGIFASNMETGDGVFVSVPNSCLWGLPLRNISRSARRRMSLTVTISYTDSVDTAFRVLKEVITQEVLFLKEPAPQIMVQSMDESGIVIFLRAWAPSNVFDLVFNKQKKNIQEKLEEAGLNLLSSVRGVQSVKSGSV